MGVFEDIKKHEGFSGTPYLCPAGFWSIGYGRNLESNPLNYFEKVWLNESAGIPQDEERDFNITPLNRREAEYLLKNDLNNVLKYATRLPYYAELNHERRGVIINMIFNLGFGSFQKFTKMDAALKVHDYETASIEMLDSKWARQVKGRAIELSRTMKGENT